LANTVRVPGPRKALLLVTNNTAGVSNHEWWKRGVVKLHNMYFGRIVDMGDMIAYLSGVGDNIQYGD
jgi:hypothetical protein